MDPRFNSKTTLYVVIVIFASVIAISSVYPKLTEKEPTNGRPGHEVLEETNKRLAEEFQYLDRGRQFMKEGKYEEAIEEFLVLRQYRSSLWSVATERLVTCYEMLGDYENAIKYEEEFLNNSAEWSKDERRAKLDELRAKLAASKQ